MINSYGLKLGVNVVASVSVPLKPASAVVILFNQALRAATVPWSIVAVVAKSHEIGTTVSTNVKTLTVLVAVGVS